MKTALLMLVTGILFGIMACHKGQDVSAIQPSVNDSVRHVTPVITDTSKATVSRLISRRSYTGLYRYDYESLSDSYRESGPDTMLVFQYQQDSIVTKSVKYDFLMTYYNGDTLVYSGGIKYHQPCLMFPHSFSEVQNYSLHIDVYNIGPCAAPIHSQFDGLPL